MTHRSQKCDPARLRRACRSTATTSSDVAINSDKARAAAWRGGTTTTWYVATKAIVATMIDLVRRIAGAPWATLQPPTEDWEMARFVADTDHDAAAADLEGERLQVGVGHDLAGALDEQLGHPAVVEGNHRPADGRGARLRAAG